MRLWSGGYENHPIMLNCSLNSWVVNAVFYYLQHFHSSYNRYILIACKMLRKRVHDVLELRISM